MTAKLFYRRFFYTLLAVIIIHPGHGKRVFATGLSELSEHASAATASYQDDIPPRPSVRKVRFEGNETYPAMVFREIIATEAPGFFRKLLFWKKEGFEFAENEVRRDVIRIRNFYNRRGFYNARVQYDVGPGRKDHFRHVTFLITENEPIRIDSINIRIEADSTTISDITGERSYIRALRRNPLSVGNRYELIRFPDVENHFLDSFRNLGYAFPNISMQGDVDTLARTAVLNVVLDPGPKSYFNTFEVEGAETVTEAYVLRESDIRPGDEFSQRKLINARREVFGHHLFRFATLGLPEQPRDSTVHLLVRVREYPLRSIELRGGIGSEEIVRGLASWTHRNPFSTAHRFSVTLRGSVIEQRANIEYLFPYVLNTYGSFSVSPFAQRLNETSFLLLKGGVNNSFIYQYRQNLLGTIGYEYSRNEEFTRNADASLPDSLARFDVSSLQLSGFYSQSFIDQGQGWAIRPNVEISGFFGTGSLQFEKLSLDVRRFIDFSRRTQLALRIDSGILFARNIDELPANILLYTGGSNSVRGYGRNQVGPKRAVFNSAGDFEAYLPTGGSSRLTFNAEIRQGLDFLMGGFGMVVFLDGGQVWSDYDDTRIQDLKFGAGGGLRYRSPIGPIRLDIGYKLNPDDEDLQIFNGVKHGGRIARWGIHFSIGQAF
ncbi:MAG: outer membrane protein assembly factor [Cyclonatronaceae bacterium]